ncbi:hypothetical protein A2617_03655 [Candidatus Daviesbacteria bacterium RIFOXYD1_FULL_41_10]|uniref:Uncharacterized protein n=1 Tax=Candidatus Daviesbacteria bacterium RIFOXYD1_FULL_41_10 TaxID=1797801 RepID=A0A1F5N0U9_9BACT|nr:MAG: hypothetical protein A2617_03655 [Candidatus Daviesbacteria bacterium RIFOXYD1_FULL_41_10]
MKTEAPASIQIEEGKWIFPFANLKNFKLVDVDKQFDNEVDNVVTVAPIRWGHIEGSLNLAADLSLLSRGEISNIEAPMGGVHVNYGLEEDGLKFLELPAYMALEFIVRSRDQIDFLMDRGAEIDLAGHHYFLYDQNDDQSEVEDLQDGIGRDSHVTLYMFEYLNTSGSGCEVALPYYADDQAKSRDLLSKIRMRFIKKELFLGTSE